MVMVKINEHLDFTGDEAHSEDWHFQNSKPLP